MFTPEDGAPRREKKLPRASVLKAEVLTSQAKPALSVFQRGWSILRSNCKYTLCGDKSVTGLNVSLCSGRMAYSTGTPGSSKSPILQTKAYACPIARIVAEDLKVNLADVKGTGRKGMICVHDVKNYAAVNAKVKFSFFGVAKPATFKSRLRKFHAVVAALAIYQAPIFFFASFFKSADKEMLEQTKQELTVAQQNALSTALKLNDEKDRTLELQNKLTNASEKVVELRQKLKEASEKEACESRRWFSFWCST